MGSHFSVVLAGNGVGRPFGTFFNMRARSNRSFALGIGTSRRDDCLTSKRATEYHPEPKAEGEEN